MNDFVVVTLIFGNLVYSVHLDPDRDAGGTQDNVKALAGNAIEEYRQNKTRSTYSGPVVSQFSGGATFDDELDDLPEDGDFSKMSEQSKPNQYCSDSSCSEGDEEELGALAPMKSFQKPVDVLAANKDSWGGGTLSVMLRDDEDGKQQVEPDPNKNAATATAPAPAPVFQKPVDVLANNKGSWAMNTLSMMLDDSKGQHSEYSEDDSR